MAILPENEREFEMKLVDFDKVRWVDGFYDMLTGEQFAPMMFKTEEQIEWSIAEAKVAAIPIEWIRDYIDYTFMSPGDYFVLEKMLKEWDNENNSD